MQKRKEQMYAAHNVWEMDDYSKRYSMVKALLEALFPVLNNSRDTIVDKQFDPTGSLPKEKDLLDAISSVFENVAFFGDLLIRMHDMVQQIYNKNTEWHPILKWSVEFCNSTYLYKETAHQKHINILSMEIGYIPVEPDYYNPFKEKSRPNPKKKKKSLKSKNKRERKPRLSNHIEL
ncbi:coiled-coil domain-containing protein 134-like isoform X2 [Dysidea avara]